MRIFPPIMSKKQKNESSEPEVQKAPPPPPPPATPVKTPPPEEPAPEISPEDRLKDQLLRLQADFDNYRKRLDREKKDWIAYASEKVVCDLLPVLDNFELGLTNGAKNNDFPAMLDGFQLVYNQLKSALEKAGLTAIPAEEGDTFDPNVHEAITHMPSETIDEGKIIARTRAGWKMGEKLLRAAQVVVSSGSAT